MVLPRVPASEVRSDGSRMDYLLLHVLDEKKWVVARVPVGAPEPVTTQALVAARTKAAEQFPGYAFKVLRERP